MAILSTVHARECLVLLPSFRDARLHIHPGMQIVLLILHFSSVMNLVQKLFNWEKDICELHKSIGRYWMFLQLTLCSSYHRFMSCVSKLTWIDVLYFMTSLLPHQMTQAQLWQSAGYSSQYLCVSHICHCELLAFLLPVVQRHFAVVYENCCRVSAKYLQLMPLKCITVKCIIHLCA